MAFLNKKTRIIDIRLTERGRQLLAQNQLNIAHYAFSDTLIDYSGSLALSVKLSSSLDNVIQKNYIPIEATSMGGSATEIDLDSFLYTAPEQRASLPTFTTDATGPITLTRPYRVQTLSNYIALAAGDMAYNDNVVLIVTQNDYVSDDREKQYGANQDLTKFVNALNK